MFEMYAIKKNLHLREFGIARRSKSGLSVYVRRLPRGPGVI